MVYRKKWATEPAGSRKKEWFNLCLSSLFLKAAHMEKITSNPCVFLGCELFVINTKLFSRSWLLMKKSSFQYHIQDSLLENSKVWRKALAG